MQFDRDMLHQQNYRGEGNELVVENNILYEVSSTSVA